MDDYRDSQGYTPLTLAVKLGNHDVVNYLSIRGCDMNQEDPSNRTPLMYYILYADELVAPNSGPMQKLKLLEYARKFVSRGADINHASPTSQYGQTLLIQAIKSQKHYAIEFLLDQGADPHIMDLAGLDACDHARKWGIASDYPPLQRCHPDFRKQPTFTKDRG